MTLTLSAPGKTFLVGEYAVLAKGPALVLNTAPRFELRVTPGPAEVVGIPAGAPAARWLSERAPLLSDLRVEFVDPFAGAGGMGASGAQFVLVHALTTFLQQSFARALDGPNLKDTWSDYQTLSGDQGSGADILAQTTGGVAEVDMLLTDARPRAWPYPELGFTLVRTHQKIPTHEHLNGLGREALSLLVPSAQACVAAFGTAPVEVFIGLLRTFTDTLKDFGLRAAPTGNLVQMFEAESWCLLAKGCGALGADVVLILHPIDARERVRAFLKKTSLSVIATDEHLSHGLEVRWT